MGYVPLWCKSNFSFLEGASHPEELVDTCAELGLSAMAITDRDGVYGVVRAHIRAGALGIKLLIGAQISVEHASSPWVVLAQNRRGYGHLCELLTLGRLRRDKGECTIRLHEACEKADGLILIVPDVVAELPTRTLLDAYGDRFYAAIARHREAGDAAQETRIRAWANPYHIPLVATTEVLYHTRARRPLQDILTCIRDGVTIHRAGTRIRCNGEHALLAPRQFQGLFLDDKASVAATIEIADRCTFSLKDIRYRYPSEKLPSGMNTREWLEHLTLQGARVRYQDDVPHKVKAQIEKELALINALDYCGYFLTMWEIVEFCKRSHILCQGRGSAANSVVCFCLGVTAVDPIRMDLLFERFLSKERAEPPDIDLDIEHNRREEVIQWVYEKYGRSHAAMVANVIRYRPKSAVRDVGKALGLEQVSLDRLAKMIHRWGDVDVDEALMRHAGFDPESAVHKHLIALTRDIINFPRHLSIHPGGFLLGHEPVSTLVPIENGSMANRTVIQWDKDDIETLGLFKVDLLGLGALNHVHQCFDLIKAHRGETLDMAGLPADDRPTFEMIQRGDTVGVFQIESRAQMAMVPRLRPENYYDLVIEVSIVRPGPITGGMVHPYLRRKRGEEAVDYPHPSLEPVLKKTLGVPLFQEQVIKLAMVAADYTPGEADQLRRDMAAWRKSGQIDQHRERLISRMQAKGIAPEFAERVFNQIRGFGEYGFPESHAASFALITYVTSYLRCHYPVEFTCSLLNAQPMGFYTPATIIEDAKRHGVCFLPVDINQSEWDCTLEPMGNSQSASVRMGLRYIKGLLEKDARAIIKGRVVRPFASMNEFSRRITLNERSWDTLAESGAFDGLNAERRKNLWDARGYAKTTNLPIDDNIEPELHFRELEKVETIAWDYGRMGLSTVGHPLSELRATLEKERIPSAKILQTYPDKTKVRYVGLVICRQRPATASGVTFMTMEDETGFVNLVVWKQVFERYAIIARTHNFLGVNGRLQVQDSVVHLIAEHLWVPKLDLVIESRSRDFQ